MVSVDEPSLRPLEARFKGVEPQQVDPAAQQYLLAIGPTLDIDHVMVTDAFGNNAVITSVKASSDFVQRDEEWWQTAWKTGVSAPEVKTNDADKKSVIAEQSHVITNLGGHRVGVVKVKFGLASVDGALKQGIAGTPVTVDLVDSTASVIAGSIAMKRGVAFPGFKVASDIPSGAAFSFVSDSNTVAEANRVQELGAAAPAQGGRWSVVASEPQAVAYPRSRPASRGRVSALVGGGAALIFGLNFFGRGIERRITAPAAELAAAAEAVAAGDLSTRVSSTSADDEIGRLSRAVAAMIDELRRLVGALNESALETSSMAGDITASSEEMAASASQIAHTAGDLSAQSTLMAETIHLLATSSEDLVRVSASLGTGAKEGVVRNTQLRQLSLENRARLDQSTRALESLSADAESSRTSIEALALASEEVRSFVTLVQKLARQSKLLALNAAMEAARAGEHGHGFAVVAEEVRRLAAMSSDAAERTERVVHGVLQGIAQSRTSTERTVATVQEVRGATEDGSRSFGEIEKAVVGAEQWTTSIHDTAEAASGLVRVVREKLDTLASGTESFAAAMQEVAASSEEQSASTEQIAASASTLASAADRLTQLVTNLRLEHTTEFAAMPKPRPAAPARGTPAWATSAVGGPPHRTITRRGPPAPKAPAR